MALKHDSQGFLIGEIIDGNRDLLRGQQASMSLWRGIRADVSAIARAIGVQTQVAARARQPGQVNATPVRATGGGRTAGGNWMGGAASPAGRSSRVAAVAGPAGSVARRSAAAAAGGSRATAAVSAGARDSKGRFTAGAKPDKGGADKGGPDSSGGGSMGGAVDRLSNAVGRMASSLSATDNLDPSINAAKEVTDVVAPLGRGLATMFGRNSERRKERWYNRIWTALTKKREDKVIVAGGGGGGLLGGLGGKAGVPGAGGLLGGVGGLMRRGGGLLKGGGKLLRRIPVLGALLAGGGAIASMLGMDDDESKTPEENRAQRYKGTGEAVGMGVGGVLGGVLGSLLGPAGTVAGALVGSIVGEKVGGAVGDWTKGLVDSDIGGQIVEGWNVFTAGVTAAWDSLTTDLKASWETITTKAGEWWDKTADVAKTVSDKVGSIVDGADQWLKSKGINVGEIAGKAWDGAKSLAGEAASRAYDNLVPNTVKRAIAAGSSAVTQAKAGYDEARGNPTTAPAPANALQTGARSAGNMAGNGINRIVETGAGYNVVQKADGSVIRQDGARNWRNNNPGNIEAGKFASSMGAIGSDGRFAIFPSYEAGRAAKSKLIFDGKGYKDLSLTDAISRYAPPSENNTKAYQSSVLAAVGGSNRKMSDYSPAEREAIMDAMQKVEGYRAGKTTMVAGASSAPRLAAVNGPSVPTGVAANVPASVPANIPPVPSDSATTTMNSGAGGGRGTVGVTIKNDISQNVPDRGVAHVQTGGMGA